MTAFRTLPAGRPLRAVVVGAGGMGREWTRTVQASPDVDLVAIVDLDRAAAERAAAELGAGVLVDTDLTTAARRAEADVVVDVTVPAAHFPVTVQALELGLPLLGEKTAGGDARRGRTPGRGGRPDRSAVHGQPVPPPARPPSSR